LALTILYHSCQSHVCTYFLCRKNKNFKDFQFQERFVNRDVSQICISKSAVAKLNCVSPYKMRGQFPENSHLLMSTAVISDQPTTKRPIDELLAVIRKRIEDNIYTVGDQPVQAEDNAWRRFRCVLNEKGEPIKNVFCCKHCARILAQSRNTTSDLIHSCIKKFDSGSEPDSEYRTPSRLPAPCQGAKRKIDYDSSVGASHEPVHRE
jgi:hypothetical protein